MFKAKKGLTTRVRKTLGHGLDLVTLNFAKAYCGIRRIQNRRQPRLLIYTDSRGFEITKRWNKDNPLSSYVKYFIDNYNTVSFICPEKHTTIIDFLHTYKQLINAGEEFDAIILHAGIVDFSRRHKPMVERLYQEKALRLQPYFDPDELHDNLQQETGYTYEGEPTCSFYSFSMARTLAEHHLAKLPNLIWIGCNQIVPNWRGTYWKERPADMPIVVEYSTLFEETLPNTISLRHWTQEDVKNYTSDNVHPNKAGFEFLRQEVVKKLQALGVA